MATTNEKGLQPGPCRFGLWALGLVVTIGCLLAAALANNGISRKEFEMHREHNRESNFRIEAGLAEINAKIDKLTERALDEN